MTKKIYKTGKKGADHTKFGGLIYITDFYTNHTGKAGTDGSSVARRIIRDQRFDEECRKNQLLKQNF